MSRTNPIGLLLGIFSIGGLAVIWLWTHHIGAAVQLWGTWAFLVHGCISGFYIWLHGLRCARLIKDIPLSNIGTAAQGYTELFGAACQFEDQKAKSIAGVPILWMRRETAQRNDSNIRDSFPFNLFFTTTGVEESETPFAIKDATGTACILPYGAEIICARESVEYLGDTKITEEQIMEGDPIYVVGNFSSESPVFNFQEEYVALVEKWRKDPWQSSRFDVNKDGRLDSRELLALHRAAADVVVEREAREANKGQIHIVHRPADDRIFLVSTIPPKQLAGHYYWWLTIGLAMFFGCGAAAFVMIKNHVI